MLKYCLFAVILATVGATNFYQIHNPRTSFGYVYNNGSADAIVKIDMYMGLQCEDAANAVPAIRAAAEKYGPKMVKLTFHVFPLPYFTGDFLSCKGTRVVSNLNPEKVIDFMQSVMMNQYRIGRAPCTITDLELMELLTDLAVELGVDRDRFYVQFANPYTTNHCKQQWKAYIASGIYGSPTFKVNGVMVQNWNTSWTKYEWMDFIDFMLAPPPRGEFTTPGIMW